MHQRCQTQLCFITQVTGPVGQKPSRVVQGSGRKPPGVIIRHVELGLEPVICRNKLWIGFQHLASNRDCLLRSFGVAMFGGDRHHMSGCHCFTCATIHFCCDRRHSFGEEFLAKDLKGSLHASVGHPKHCHQNRKGRQDPKQQHSHADPDRCQMHGQVFQGLDSRQRTKTSLH